MHKLSKELKSKNQLLTFSFDVAFWAIPPYHLTEGCPPWHSALGAHQPMAHLQLHNYSSSLWSDVMIRVRKRDGDRGIFPVCITLFNSFETLTQPGECTTTSPKQTANQWHCRLTPPHRLTLALQWHPFNHVKNSPVHGSLTTQCPLGTPCLARFPGMPIPPSIHE